MLDLEVQLARVANAEVRPLVKEAHRCYTTGAARAAIVLTWTAVCADLIDKIATLYQSGEAQAADLTNEVAAVQGKLDRASIVAMQGVESRVLDTAVTLELIDATQRVQLERLREDRNLCAHPSLRPMGELFDPPLEYARAHLAVALDAVLVHPASQGRKVVEAFAEHILDPGFLGDPLHIAYAFFRQVRPTARRRVVEFAARHAMLEPALPDHPAVAPADVADRMAQCLRIFAAEDRDLVAEMVGKFAQRWSTLPQVEIQRRTLVRLGDLDAFWSGMSEPMLSHLDAMVRDIGERHKGKAGWEAPDLESSEVGALALAALAEVRSALPSLEGAMDGWSTLRRARVVAQRPSPYFAEFVGPLLEEASSFDNGGEIQRVAVLPCAVYMTADQLQAALTAWAANSQCWGWGAIDNVVRLFHATAHLGTARDSAFRDFFSRLDALAGTASVVDYKDIANQVKGQIAGLLSPEK
ncbi:hypothetical protein [Streptacidiphilus neutrinimicus]|uniref:hypothetical protein n=1 Tax=Streptacidiphilus neutrinimicus TaxID=105420 RepID=UPI000694B5D4|nr:hypothetical protein [Streptacidiphilus neutrinimicus]